MLRWIVHGVDSDVYGARAGGRPGDRAGGRSSALAPVLEDGPATSSAVRSTAGDALTALAEIQYNADELSQQVLFKP